MVTYKVMPQQLFEDLQKWMGNYSSDASFRAQAFDLLGLKPESSTDLNVLCLIEDLREMSRGVQKHLGGLSPRMIPDRVLGLKSFREAILSQLGVTDDPDAFRELQRIGAELIDKDTEMSELRELRKSLAEHVHMPRVTEPAALMQGLRSQHAAMVTVREEFAEGLGLDRAMSSPAILGTIRDHVSFVKGVATLIDEPSQDISVIMRRLKATLGIQMREVRMADGEGWDRLKRGLGVLGLRQDNTGLDEAVTVVERAAQELSQLRKKLDASYPQEAWQNTVAQLDRANERWQAEEDKVRTIDNMMRAAGWNGGSDVVTRVSTLLKERQDQVERDRMRVADARPRLEAIFSQYEFALLDNGFEQMVGEILGALPLFTQSETEQSLADGYKVMADLQRQRDAARDEADKLRQQVANQTGEILKNGTLRCPNPECDALFLDESDDVVLQEFGQHWAMQHMNFPKIDEVKSEPRRFPEGSPEPTDVKRVRSELNGVVFKRVRHVAGWHATPVSGGDDRYYGWREINNSPHGAPLVEVLE